ncbi:MAG: hypothetical protein ACYTFG_15280, partial [Planctomycetota bacterium]
QPAELPVSAFKSISVGITVRSELPKTAPKGYDTLFDFNVGGQLDKSGKTRGGVQVRILHRGLTHDSAQLFWQAPRARPVALPRIEKPISTYYIPFGPLRLRGVPAFTMHLYFPSKLSESWKKGTKRLYLLPVQCMTGEVRIQGKTYSVALLDRTLNGKWSDPCTLNAREGDWFLVDENRDKKFSVNLSSSESRGLTRCIPLAGHSWTLSCRGKSLYFKPVKLPTIRVELEGVGESTTLIGWSQATGSLSMPLDEKGGIEIPREKFQLYSYSWTKEKWRLFGTLKKLGVLKAPASGKTSIEVGPTLACTLTRTNQGEDMRFSFKCSGRAGESVTPYKDNKRVEPVFIVTERGGEEVFRKAKNFG